MVLVPFKKTLTFYFATVCMCCSVRSLIHGMTTLSPSVNFPVYGLGFLFGVYLVERTVLGSGCLVGLCEGDPFPLQEIQV